MWSSRTGESGRGDLSRESSGHLNSGSDRKEGIERISHVAVIGKGMVIKGEIKSKEDLHVDGEIEGTLQMSGCRLSVSREGKLGADVSAREIELMGVAHGDLHATSKITIRKGARLVGDLRAPGIVIEEGAYVKGKIEIVNNFEQASTAIAEPNVRKAAAG